ncbi:MAG: tail fiber domain-containing protein [Patescibacteria group bacterium]
MKRTLTTKKYLLSAMLVVGIFSATTIFAASPSKSLGFQGQLYSSGAPLSSSVNATFTFYDALSGGAVTGSPIVKTVTVANGYFGTSFTEADTTGVNFNQALYVQVNINGTDLSPRTALNAVPTALKSFGAFSYASAPTVGPAGSLYFNTTDNTLYISNGTTWTVSTPWVTSGTDITYIAGKVGVGTSTPSELFHVVNPAGTASLRISGANGGFLRIEDTNVADSADPVGRPFGYMRMSAGVLRFGNANRAATNTTASSDKMIITTPGDVGIGSSVVDARLVVAGSGTYVLTGAASSSGSLNLRSFRYAISANEPIGMINFSSNDSQLTDPGTTTAFIRAMSAQVHTPTVLDTDLIFGTTVGTTTSERMRIMANGFVGIGTSTPTAQFTTTGTVRFASLGAGSLSTDALGNVTVSSDERLKDIQGEFKTGLEKILGLNPIMYKWKPETGYDTTNAYAGFSAQNVQENIPEAVGTDGRGFLTLADRPILAALVNAVKELAAKVEGFAEAVKTKLVETDIVKTKNLCVQKTNGQEVCITGDQIETLMTSQNINIIQQPLPSVPPPAPTSSSTPEQIVEVPVTPAPAPEVEPAVQPVPDPIPAPVTDTTTE